MSPPLSSRQLHHPPLHPRVNPMPHLSVRRSAVLAAITFLSAAVEAADKAPVETGVVHYKILLDTVTKGYDGNYCWVHPRAGIVPRGENRSPAVVLTMQKLWLKGSDVFFALTEMRTNDLGRAWMGPYEHTDTLGRRDEPNGVIVAASDFWPKWHAKSGKLLGIGHTVRYTNNRVDGTMPRQTVYSVYDAERRIWTAWTTLPLIVFLQFGGRLGAARRFAERRHLAAGLRQIEG